MARFGLVGPSYQSQSLNADCQRTVNWFVESIESQMGKTSFAMYPSPGLAVFATLTDSPVRGEFFFGNRMFAVAGSTLFEVFSDGTKAARSAVSNDGKPAIMVCGPLHLLVASGGHAYVMVLATNAVTDLTTAGTLPAVSSVGYSDGFFLALKQNSNQWFASAALDATTWPGASTAQVSVFPDNVLAMVVDHREVVLCGPKQSQFYYDSGNFPFPFDVIPGAFVELGISDPATLIKLDNTTFLLGADERGARMAWRIQGYNPQRISNHAVETAWQSYPQDGTATAYSWQYLGHLFWQTNFPTANSGNGATWVFDVTTGLWWERDHFVNGVSKAHQSGSHVFAFGKHLVGDPNSANIYTMSAPVLSGSAWSFADDAGNPIRRLRRSPIMSVENQWMHFDELIIDVEAGLGPIPPLLQGGGYDSTRIQSSGGSATLKYFRDLGITVNGDSYQVSVLVKNQGPTAVTVASNISGSATIQPGTAQQVSFPYTGDGVTNQQMRFSTANTGDAMDIIAVNPVMQHNNGPNLLSGADLTFAGSWAGFGGNSITLTQSQPNPLSSPRDPQLMLRWSDDSAKTWSNIDTLNCGQAGNYKARARRSRLGRSRNRVFELTATDPIPWRITDGYLRGTGNQYQERLPKELAKRA